MAFKITNLKSISKNNQIKLNNMESFFNIEETQRFSFTEKIKYILNQLDAVLHPVIIKKERVIFVNRDYPKYDTTHIFCNVCNVTFEKTYFNSSINVTIKDNKVQITGETFEYTFVATEILTIFDKFNKLK